MPELTFTVRWPDGSLEDCWSPSLVVHDHLVEGEILSVAEFHRRSTQALHAASERVRAAYGFPCSRSAASAERIRSRAAGFAADATVTVVRLWPPLPGPTDQPGSTDAQESRS